MDMSANSSSLSTSGCGSVLLIFFCCRRCFCSAFVCRFLSAASAAFISSRLRAS
jgi:hypothetical protein